MKRIVACVLALIWLFSLASVTATAENLIPEGIGYTPGKYLGGDPGTYQPVGDVTVAWRPDLSSVVKLDDGDLSDWYASGLSPVVITPHNMISWVGDTAEESFKIISFSAADSDYLYLAFDVLDSQFAYSENPRGYNGDAIQLCLDFGRKLGDMTEKNPDMLTSVKNIFYTVTCVADGEPIQIMRQESDRDGPLSEANGDEVKGCARKTELGWSVEFALSWQLLYDDYVWKAWDDGRLYVREDLPLLLGASLYYLNRDETGGEILWAAGTLKDCVDTEKNPVVTWMTYDNGILWKLPITDEVTLNCSGISILAVDHVPETEPDYDTEIGVSTEIVVDPLPMPPVEWETIPVQETLRDASEDSDVDEDIRAILEKYGCASAVGVGSLAVITALAAAALACRKRK